MLLQLAELYLGMSTELLCRGLLEELSVYDTINVEILPFLLCYFGAPMLELKVFRVCVVKLFYLFYSFI